MINEILDEYHSVDNNTIEDNDLENILSNNDNIEKKKRGRKPKNHIAPIVEKNNDPLMDILTLKKRGRKSSTNKIINLNNDTNNDMLSNIIAHLPLKINDILKIISDNSENKEEPTKINLKPTVPKFVDFYEDINDNHNIDNNCNTYCKKCLILEEHIRKLEEDISNLKNGIIHNNTNFNKKIYESKVNFLNKSINKWEDTTNISCWWCCHKFDTIPLGIPEFITKDNFYLFGCFCSFNCMMAYNVDLNDYKIWDRQANIYQLKNRLDPTNKITIHPAPPRQTLNIFGGPLDIREFRESFFVLNKEFRYFFPPMISIIGIIEEDNRDLSGGTKIKINKLVDKPLIKRKTQLPNKTNKLTDFIKQAE